MDQFDDNENRNIIEMLMAAVEENDGLAVGEKTSWYKDDWQLPWNIVRKNLDTEHWILA